MLKRPKNVSGAVRRCPVGFHKHNESPLLLKKWQPDNAGQKTPMSG